MPPVMLPMLSFVPPMLIPLLLVAIAFLVVRVALVVDVAAGLALVAPDDSVVNAVFFLPMPLPSMYVVVDAIVVVGDVVA
jgi:hypothetical protein